MTNFSTIYKNHSSHVFRFVFSLCRDSDLANDITSETFLKAFNSPAEKKNSSIRAYLFTIARHTYYAHYRKHKQHINDLPENLEADNKVNPLLEDALELIGKLPKEDRALITLYAQNSLSYKEIATITELSVANVKVRLYRIRQRLKKELEEE
jgi:RNA polymerase sigma-70 factor (ECF subfamily)